MIDLAPLTAAVLLVGAAALVVVTGVNLIRSVVRWHRGEEDQ
jgi:hypothetical protein